MKMLSSVDWYVYISTVEFTLGNYISAGIETMTMFGLHRFNDMYDTLKNQSCTDESFHIYLSNSQY